MALAGTRTQFEQSDNGTVYGVHTETVAVQGDNGELVDRICCPEPSERCTTALYTYPGSSWSCKLLLVA